MIIKSTSQHFSQIYGKQNHFSAWGLKIFINLFLAVMHWRKLRHVLQVPQITLDTPIAHFENHAFLRMTRDSEDERKICIAINMEMAADGVPPPYYAWNEKSMYIIIFLIYISHIHLLFPFGICNANGNGCELHYIVVWPF